MLADEILDDEKYGPDGYWPEGTPPPARLTEGCAAISRIIGMIKATNTPRRWTVGAIKAMPEFLSVHQSDIVDAIDAEENGVVL